MATLVYFVVNFALVGLQPGELSVYVVQPFLWSCLAATGFIFWKYGIRVKPPLAASIVFTAALIGVFQVAVFAAGGLLFGFGASPYSRQPLPMLGNMVYVITQLAGIEMARACIVGVLGGRAPTLAVVAATLFFTLLAIPLPAVAAVTEAASLFRFMGEVFLPTVAENLLASFLTIAGGPAAAIAYRGTLDGFEWLSPALPNLQWLAIAFLGTMAPGLGLLVVRGEALPEEAGDVPDDDLEQVRSSNAWMLVVAVTAALVFFNAGFLGVRPTLVVGASMEPALLPGDVAITKEVPAGDVRVGDVIRYRTGDSFVLHRVMALQHDASGSYFITRGDANNTEDPPVIASQLDGKVVLVVPKIGLVAIGFHTLINWLR